MPRQGYKAFNFSLDPEIQNDFKHECFMNSRDMSEVIQEFMEKYSKISLMRRRKNKLDGTR